MPIENDPSPASADPEQIPAEPRTGIREMLRHFSPSERLTLYILTFTLALSAFILVGSANDRVSTQVPTEGGQIVEGAVGTPRFVNPVLAATPADEDLTMLIYSGLVRTRDGSFVPDLAENYEISEDGTVYTFHLRHGLTFHDGSPLTASDVLFTIALVQDPEIKSPRRADWDGVAVEAPDDYTLVFTLPHPYAPFIENATLGILPQERWDGVPASEFPFHALNTRPIGSGPYAIRDVETDETGAPTQYRLRSFHDFALGEPHITDVIYRAFPNEDALLAAADDGDVTSYLAQSPKEIPADADGTRHPLPLMRVFGIFFNQSHAPVLADAAVREALGAAIPKDVLVQDVLGGYGTPIDAPVPAGLLAPAASTTAEQSPADAARDILQSAGWTLSSASSSENTWSKGDATLSIALAIPDTPDIVASAEAVAAAWRAADIQVRLEVYPLSEFNQTVLRPRSYDAILFGEVVGRSLDLFPFWHSSQRNDPGLNLSQYANTEADRALASARAATDQEAREAFIREFLAQIQEDRPAVFLYSPEAAYVLPENVHGVDIGPVVSAAERFAEIHTWYRDTERVWDFFINR